VSLPEDPPFGGRKSLSYLKTLVSMKCFLHMFLFLLLVGVGALNARVLVEVTSEGAVSQTTSHGSGSFPASNAVDGDLTTFNHTDSGGVGGALELSFPIIREVARVELVTRGDCCGGRLSGATLRLFGAGGEVEFETLVEGTGPLSTFVAEIPDGISANRVRVGFEPDENGIVHLAEMRVFSPTGEPPAIEEFLIDGDSLSWVVTGADTVKLFGMGEVAASGSVDVFPQQSVTYVLSATNLCDTVTAVVSVEVGGEAILPRITEFSAFPEDWVEIWNPANEVVSLSGWSLTDDVGDLRKWSFDSEVNLVSGGFLVVEEPFGLAREEGSFLALVDPTGAIVSSFTYPRQFEAGSYGLDLEGVEQYFVVSTPGDYNLSETTQGYLEGVNFSMQRGYYDAPFQLKLSPKTAGATVMYSLDGSFPHTEYSSQLAVSATTVVRAIEVLEGYETSRSESQTYLFLDGVSSQAEFPVGFPTEWYAPGTGGALAPIPRFSDYEMDGRITGDMAEALRSIPSVCLTLPQDEMWGLEQGLHPNATSRGREWERTASMEVFDPAQGEYIHVNCGLRIHGGRGRVSEMLKKSFRLYFRGDYGETKFSYPLFEGMPKDGVDHLVLRGGTGKAWSSPWRDLTGSGNSLTRVTYLRDQFYRDSFRVMGNPSIAGSFVHLYINGLYWGLYNPTERPGGEYCANHFGGEAEEYDYLKWANLLDPQLLEGDLVVWNELVALTRGDVESNMGEIKARLDLENLADYMMVNFYTGNGDWIRNNSYGFRSRREEGDRRFKFVCWDGEELFVSLERNSTTDGRDKTNTPLELHDNLRAGSPDYRLLFADRLHRHLVDEDGVLNVDAATERWAELSEEIDQAVIAESARWGDVLRPDDPYNREDHWLPEIQNIRDTFLPWRAAISFAHMQTDGLYPDVSAPEAQLGGQEFSLSAPSGVVWYTIDGSDPRREDGTVSESAVMFAQSEFEEPIVSTASWKYLDTGVDLSGAGWNELEFDDSFWEEGLSPLGYGAVSGLSLNTTVGFGPDTTNKYITTYFRHRFEVDDPSELGELQLRYVRDDAVVIYLNGQEVVRSNLPDGEITAETTAVSGVGGDAESETHFASLPDGVILAGENVFAVEVHQRSGGSSDLGFDLSLVSIAPAVSIPLGGDARVKARAFENGEWSALEDEVFRILDPRENLVISEIMYHPADPSLAEVNAGFDDDDAFEFLEVWNVGSGSVLLDGMRFTKGVDVGLTGQLGPGEKGVVGRCRGECGGVSNEIWGSGYDPR